jgi:hypothetical protein
MTASIKIRSLARAFSSQCHIDNILNLLEKKWL